jgi:hypothetical protein
VYVERGGSVDVEAMFLLTNIDRLVEYHTFTNEMQMVPLFNAATAAVGRPITTLTAVIDMGGMSMKIASSGAWGRRARRRLEALPFLVFYSPPPPRIPHPPHTPVTINYLKAMIGIDSKHYPETLGRMFIINVPTIFSAAWALIRPFLDERTQRKIEIFSSASAWKKRLREVVEPRDLPVDFGGELPVQVFPGSRTKKTHLPAGNTFSQATDALAAGTAVRFRWFSRSADVAFEVRFERGGDAAGRREVVFEKKENPDSDKRNIDTVVTAPAAGRFVATWSNKAGWFHRDVFHRWDELVGGKPKPCGGLTAVATAASAGAPMPIVSEAPQAAGGGGGGGGGGSE